MCVSGQNGAVPRVSAAVGAWHVCTARRREPLMGLRARRKPDFKFEEPRAPLVEPVFDVCVWRMLMTQTTVSSLTGFLVETQKVTVVQAGRVSSDSASLGPEALRV